MSILSWFKRKKVVAKRAVAVDNGPAKVETKTAEPAKTIKPTTKTASKPGKKASASELRPQCAALTAAGDQCRNSARAGSKYCGAHKGYQPPSADRILEKKDTKPKARQADDTLPGTASKKQADAQPQCAAVTASGKQCRNSARAGSKYCGSHKGYRHGSTSSKVKQTDTKPRTKGAKDTRPSTRRSHVTHGDYRLYQKGNRYFFSKKTQAEAKKDGAKAVYSIPEDRTVVTTPNGLPVLKKK